MEGGALGGLATARTESRVDAEQTSEHITRSPPCRLLRDGLLRWVLSHCQQASLFQRGSETEWWLGRDAPIIGG